MTTATYHCRFGPVAIRSLDLSVRCCCYINHISKAQTPEGQKRDVRVRNKRGDDITHYEVIFYQMTLSVVQIQRSKKISSFFL